MIAIAIITGIRNRAVELVGDSAVPPAGMVTSLTEVFCGPIDVIRIGPYVVAMWPVGIAGHQFCAEFGGCGLITKRRRSGIDGIDEVEYFVAGLVVAVEIEPVDIGGRVLESSH